LPESAKELRVHIRKSLFVSRYTLRFAAETGDIERFLAESPSLKQAACERYSKERMRIASWDFNDTLGSSSRDPGRDYFRPHASVPNWYSEEIRGAGRRYEIDPWEGKWSGEVIVDDERHAVYIHVRRL
jgi:hypothetical protein